MRRRTFLLSAAAAGAVAAVVTRGTGSEPSGAPSSAPVGPPPKGDEVIAHLGGGFKIVSHIGSEAIAVPFRRGNEADFIVLDLQHETILNGHDTGITYDDLRGGPMVVAAIESGHVSPSIVTLYAVEGEDAIVANGQDRTPEWVTTELTAERLGRVARAQAVALGDSSGPLGI